MTMTSKIKLVAFDLDGTLINAYEAVLVALNYALAKMGLPPTDEQTVRRNVGWGERNFILSFVDEKDADTLRTIYREYNQENLRAYVKLLPGTLDLLKVLKERKYLIALATNRPHYSTMAILEYLNISAYFDAVVCADDVQCLKPDPEILKKVLRDFSLKPDEVLYVGDMTVDIETGRNAGVKTIAVTTGSSREDEIRELQPFRVISDISEVLTIVENTNGA